MYKKTGLPAHNYLMCTDKHFYLKMFLHGTHKRIITSLTQLIKAFCYPSKLVEVPSCVGDETTKILDVCRSKVSFSLSWKTNHKQQQSFRNFCTLSQKTLNINAKFYLLIWLLDVLCSLSYEVIEFESICKFDPYSIKNLHQVSKITEAIYLIIKKTYDTN